MHDSETIDTDDSLKSPNLEYVITWEVNKTLQLSDYNLLRETNSKELFQYHVEKVNIMEAKLDLAKKREDDVRRLSERNPDHVSIHDVETSIRASKDAHKDLTRSVFYLMKDFHWELRNSIELIRQIYYGLCEWFLPRRLTRVSVVKYSNHNISLCVLSEESIELKNWNVLTPYDNKKVSQLSEYQASNNLYMTSNLVRVEKVD